MRYENTTGGISLFINRCSIHLMQAPLRIKPRPSTKGKCVRVPARSTRLRVRLMLRRLQSVIYDPEDLLGRSVQASKQREDSRKMEPYHRPRRARHSTGLQRQPVDISLHHPSTCPSAQHRLGHRSPDSHILVLDNKELPGIHESSCSSFLKICLVSERSGFHECVLV